MLIENRGKKPQIHHSAYIAPNAVVSGDVTIGENTAVLFGAVITADGGPVTIGSDCVIMENAVVRGTPKNPARIGDAVLVGPHAHLTGCEVEDGAFLATGCSIFNGAHIGREAEVRINCVVQVNCALAPEAFMPMGWIAVGNPAQIFPPEAHEQLWPIQKAMNFSGTVWGVERGTPKREVNARYARALTRHKKDRVVEPPGN